MYPVAAHPMCTAFAGTGFGPLGETWTRRQAIPETPGNTPVSKIANDPATPHLKPGWQHVANALPDMDKARAEPRLVDIIAL